MNQLDSMASMTSIDRAAIDGYAAYASGASMPAKYAADDMLASSWRIGRRQAEERAATEKKNPVSRMNGSQVEALAQANAYLTNAGLPSINDMMGKQAEAVQNAMAPVLQVQVRNNYGAPAIYPANEAARLFADIAGTKTLKPDTLAKAKRLGYRVEQVPDPSAQLIYMPGLAALLVGA